MIVTAGEFKNAIWTWGLLRRRICNKFCFKLGKNTTETYGMLQTAFWPSCMNRASVFERHKRFKEDRESVRDDERCGRCKEVRTPELIGQIKNFMDKDHHVSKLNFIVCSLISNYNLLCYLPETIIIAFYQQILVVII